MQPVAAAKASPAASRVHAFDFNFIIALTGYWFLSLTKITVSRAGFDTFIVTVLVKLAIGLPPASRNATVTGCGPAGNRAAAKLRNCGRFSHARVSAEGVVAAEKILLMTPAASRPMTTSSAALCRPCWPARMAPL